MKRALYLMGAGALSRRQNTLCVERDGTKRYVPVEQVLEIHIFGEVDFNKRLLEFLSQHEILVHIYSYYGWYMGTFYPREHNNSGYLLLQQVAHYLDWGKRVDLARRFVFGGVQNLLHVLRYYQRRGKRLEDIIGAVERHLERIRDQQEIEQLMQVEGQARNAYYQAFDRILEDPDFEFKERSRRPPRNRVNALLSFGNSLLYTAVLAEIYRTHLDPRVGFLHATNFRRFALNLDVAEVFKPILVDRTILTVVQKRQIQAKHFDEALGGLYLKEDGRRRFLEVWEERLGSTLYHRGLKRHVSYRTLIRLELYKIEKHLLGDREYRPFRTRW